MSSSQPATTCADVGLSVVVAGAGIGGLTAALALSRRGCAVTVVERRTGFAEAGAGIQLSPNASRILIDLGLGAALRRHAAEPEAVTVRAMRSGRAIGGVALGPFMRRRFDAPFWTVHRADLQTILLDAVRSSSAVRLLVGRTVEGVEAGPEAAGVTLSTAAGARETLHADLIVGADGLRSSVRAALGNAHAPSPRGYAAWRAAVPADALAPSTDGRVNLWLGRDRHVVHYPVAGGSLINIVAVERQADPVEGWSAPGAPAEIQAAHARSAPALRDLIAAPAEWRVWSLFDLPCRRMAEGRIALIGDAAHPVLPFLAQGGALAIEDAATLAALLPTDPAGVPTALKAFESARLSRVRRVQAAARRNGRIYHSGLLLALARNQVMRHLGPERMAERYAWLYGWRAPA